MRIAIFGSGAVGGYFGVRLAQAGEDVVFIARGSHLKAMREQGLRLESPKGDALIHPVQVVEDPSQAGEVDYVILGVKAWQVSEAAAAMRRLIGEKTTVVPLQNGVEAADNLVKVLGKEHVMNGLCRVISMLAGPGHIRHLGMEPYMAFGEQDNLPSERAQRLLDACQKAGISAEVPADIMAAVWMKFLFIAPYSGLGAVTRAPAGLLRDVPQTRHLLEHAIHEVFHVGKAYKVNLPGDAVESVLASIDNLPPEGTSSMQRDIIEGRPSELEAQNGAVVRLGWQAGIQVPVNSFIYAALLPAELKARGVLKNGAE